MSNAKRMGLWLYIAAMLGAATLIKAPAIRTGAPNLEATYHALLTVSALSESPISRHHLLPSVTLGTTDDRFVPWGAALPLRSGHFVYTSFPATGFLPPLAFFELTGLPPSRGALFLFSSLLQVLVVAALATLLLRSLRVLGQPETIARRGALVGVAVQILSTEALLDYGAVYWVQQFYQLILILSLICLLEVIARMIEVPGGRGSQRWLAALCVLTFVGAWTEWSGFVFAAGAFLTLAWCSLTARQYRVPALCVGLAGLAGLAAMVAHYAAFVGLHDLLIDFFKSARARSAARGSPLGLIAGYARSFGLFLPIAGGAAWFAWKQRHMLPPAGLRIAVLVLFAASFPLIENLLLIQHAVQFSFDRLKLAVPLAMLIAAGTATLPSRPMRWIAVACVLVAAGQNAITYQALLRPYRGWAAIDRANQALAQATTPYVRLSCAVIAGTRIRGYDNLLFHRAIHEQVTPDRFRALTRTAQAKRCGALYLEGTEAFPDLSQYRSAIAWRDGKVTRLSLRRPH